MKEQLVIITPPISEDGISDGLRNLTEYLTKTMFKGEWQGSGILGGEYGYGVNYENDIFMMHPFCWCEEETCDWCNGDAPNFLYKPTGFEARWYKYIGRSPEFNKELTYEEWIDIYQDCIKSLTAVSEP